MHNKTIFTTTEIANVAAFLASGKSSGSNTLDVSDNGSADDASYINGQNISVDGGLTASLPVIPGRWA
jgi:NAD(P)-dependent dehydrogenase (short-subunit alcohol dehydrogenase family)